MSKDFEWPPITYYVEMAVTSRLVGNTYIDGPTMIPDSSYGDVILTPKLVRLGAMSAPSSFSAWLAPEEANELVLLLGVKLEAFFRK